MARLKKSDYTTSELIEITKELDESEKKNYELNNAFWSRAEKDASQIRRKYYAQVERMLGARVQVENNQNHLFGS